MSQITKKAIEASLSKLLQTKPLDKITINDIAEDCGINRMTFYYHFSDIYDLVEWSWEECVAKAIENHKSHDTWQQGLLEIFRALEKNKTLVMNVCRGVSREKIEKYLYDITYGLLIDIIKETAGGRSIEEEDKAFIADFYKYGFVGLMLDWVKSDMKEASENIVNRLSALMKGSFDRALDAFEKNKI